MPVAVTQPVYPPSAGQPIEATWGDNVSERVIQPFLSIADRDAKWTAPPQGAMCSTLDTNTIWYRTAGAWISVAGAPAYVGFRRDNPHEAQFGHVDTAVGVGYIAQETGDNQILMANNKALRFWQRNTGGTGYDLFCWFTVDRSAMNGMGMGRHPVHGGYRGIWMEEYPGGNSYVFLMDGTSAILNGSSGVSLRVSGSSQLNVYATSTDAAGDLNVAGGIYSRRNFIGYEWYRAQFIGQPYDNNNVPHLALLGGASVAPQLFANALLGESFHVQNGSGNAYAPIAASAFQVNSALDTKRDVRPLRPERTRLGRVLINRKTDTVDLPDILSLRPVAFRPKVPAQEIVAADAALPVDFNDPATFRSADRDPDTWLGQEGVRERLGLVADEVQHVIPSAVVHDNDGAPFGIDYAQIVVALLDHVQGLTLEVRELRAKIETLSTPSTNGQTTNGDHETVAAL